MEDKQNKNEEVEYQAEYLHIPNEEGVEEKFEIIHEFDHPTNGYRYLLLVPFSEDESEEEVDVYPVRCKISDDEDTCDIEPLETEEEWDMVEKELQALEEDMGEDDSN